MNQEYTKKDKPYAHRFNDPLQPSQQAESTLNHQTQKHTFKGQRGTTSVEFAITSTVFFLFLFMIIDFSIYGFVKLTMQHAVREGTRYAVTGQVNLDPDEEGDRKRAVIQQIKDNSLGLFDTVMDETDIVVTDSTGSIISGFGDPQQSIVVTLNCRWPIINPFTQFIFASGHYNFSVGTSMRNEYFPGVAP